MRPVIDEKGLYIFAGFVDYPIATFGQGIVGRPARDGAKVSAVMIIRPRGQRGFRRARRWRRLTD
jgi:hypothetical protein